MSRAMRYRRVAALAAILPVSAALMVSAALPVAGMSVAGAQVSPPHAPMSGTKWTKISKDTKLGIASPGLFRTADGRLHVIWSSQDGPGQFSLHYSTVGGATKLLATGTIESHWAGMAFDPRLAPGLHGGLQLIFTGANGVSGSPYNTGAEYLARSNSAGKSWVLVPGSLSQSGLVTETDAAAAAEPNGTPVAAWSEFTSLAYHVGIDPSSPAKSPDQHLGIGADGGLINPALVKTSSGTIMAGWYNNSDNAKAGYYAARILPSKGAKVKAPNSGSTKQANGQPFQPVALVAHPGGGSYLAYCVPTKFLHCGHIALWRVGAARALTVPGSSSGMAGLVTLTAGHAGHLWISWFDTGTNKIRVVRTNTAVTKFGAVRTISAPAPLSSFQTLSALGGSGPLDLIALATLNHQGSSPAYFVTELFPALRIHASKARVSHLRSTTISFTVDDSGDGVAGATVKFLGKTAKTNSKGVVRFTVKKGTAKGKHVAIATKSGYASATFTVTVT